MSQRIASLALALAVAACTGSAATEDHDSSNAAESIDKMEAVNGRLEGASASGTWTASYVSDGQVIETSDETVELEVSHTPTFEEIGEHAENTVSIATTMKFWGPHHISVAHTRTVNSAPTVCTGASDDGNGAINSIACDVSTKADDSGATWNAHIEYDREGFLIAFRLSAADSPALKYEFVANFGQ